MSGTTGPNPSLILFYSPSSDEPTAAVQIISSQDNRQNNKRQKTGGAIIIVTSISFWTPFLKFWSRNLELISHNVIAGQWTSNLDGSSLHK